MSVTLIEPFTTATKGLVSAPHEWVRRGADFMEVESETESRVLSVIVGACTIHTADLKGAKKMWGYALEQIYGHRQVLCLSTNEIDQSIRRCLRLLDYGDIFVADPVAAIQAELREETGIAGLRWYDPILREEGRLRGIAARRASHSFVLRPDARRIIRLAYDEVSGESLAKIQKTDFLKSDNRAHTQMRQCVRSLTIALEAHRHKEPDAVVKEILYRIFSEDGVRRPPDPYYTMTQAVMRLEQSMRHHFRCRVPVHLATVTEANLLKEEAVLWCSDMRHHVLAKATTEL